jgi:microcystin-dependent protein
MSSPVTGSDFSIASLGQSFCERITNLLALSARVKELLDWMFDADGNANQDLISMFQAPPGVVTSWYSSISNESDAAKAVRRLGRTQVDIATYDADADPTKALWVLCDGSQSWIPDLRGRFVLGAGAGTGLTGRSPKDTGGTEETTLTEEQIPEHNHSVSLKQVNDGTDVPDVIHQYTKVKPASQGNNDFSWNNSTGTDTQFNYNAKISETDFGGGLAHDNMPPFYTLYYIMRTDRQA